METSTHDLALALAFVFERISAAAERSGSPLNDNERYLLSHLPTHPTNPLAHRDFYEALPIPILRDPSFERLCTLAKMARLYDFQTLPRTTRAWDFATAVLQLNRHPMAWLLGWAGVGKRSSRWNRILLVSTALLVVLIFFSGALVLSSLLEGHGEVWRRTVLVAGALVYVGVVSLLYIGAQRLDKLNLRRAIEKSRPPLNPTDQNASMLEQFHLHH